MRKVQTGYQAPLFCTLLVFIQADGQCFMPSIIVYQAKEYSKDLHFNIPLDWTVHHTPSGYMDRERCLKPMNQFYHAFGASPVKNQTILFDGHDIHFDDRPLIHMEHRNI